jgi:cell division protein FtsL
LRVTRKKNGGFRAALIEPFNYAASAGGAGLFIAALIFTAVMVVGLFYVRTRMSLVEIGYEVSNLETRNRDLNKRCTELNIEIAFLESPADLEKKASKIGLVFPSAEKVIHVP